MYDVERFGLALLNFVAESSKHRSGSEFEIAWFSDEARKLFISIAQGQMCATDISKLSSIRERAILIYWLHLRRFPSPSLLDYFDTVKDVEDHFRNYERTILASDEYKSIGRFDLSHEALFGDHAPRPPKIFIDVSNTINSRARTGIQRVVREVGERLASNGSATLIYTNRELAKFVEVDIATLDASGTSRLPKTPAVTFQRGDLYFDLDASWGEPVNKFLQYAQLKHGGVRILTMHHDAVPILFPHFSHNNTVGRFIEHFLASITFSDRIICNSEAVRTDLQNLCRKLNYRIPKTAVIRLGSDFAVPTAASGIQRDAQEVINNGPYALCVGTVEPRKNYGALLSCLQSIRDLGLTLVIVGKVGWEEPEVIRSLDDACANGQGLIWLKSADDASLHELYNRCDFLIAASFYEGFGLPIIEGLSRGCLIVSSNGGAQPEVLGDRGIVFQLEKPNSLIQAIATAAQDNQLRTELRDRAHGFVPASWRDTIKDLSNQFEDFLTPVLTKKVEAIQLVYISIRPDNLARSLRSFKEHFNTPISSVLVLTSAGQRQEIDSVVQASGLKSTVLLDENVLPRWIGDHAERNFALRSFLYASEYVEEAFLALDDDTVLLRPLGIDHFRLGNKVLGFCSYPSMLRWQASPFSTTSYDHAQWHTGSLLAQFGYPDKAFAAHRPQLIVKKIAREIFDEFATLPDRQLDEWSLYFNVACSRYCDGFRTRRTTTLYWPDRLNSWQPEWFDADIYFENFYAHNYEPGGLAYESGISQDDDWRVKRATYANEYNKYYFQELLDVSFENISASVVEVLGDPVFSNEAIVGLADLWKPVRTTCETHEDITYEVRTNDVMIVHGLEPQVIGRTRPLYIKCPEKPGRYDLALFKRGLLVSQARLLILPVAGN